MLLLNVTCLYWCVFQRTNLTSRHSTDFSQVILEILNQGPLALFIFQSNIDTCQLKSVSLYQRVSEVSEHLRSLT
jgi:hypothetical protein